MIVATAFATPRGPSWIPPLIYRLGLCETHLNFRTDVWVHGVHYEGFVNWASGTWDADKHGISRADHAYQATPRQQVRVAIRSVYVEHRYFGCLVGAQHAWVRG